MIELWLLNLNEFEIVSCGFLLSGCVLFLIDSGMLGFFLVRLMVGGVSWFFIVRIVKIVLSVLVLLSRWLVVVLVVDMGILCICLLNMVRSVLYLVMLLIGVLVVCVLMWVILLIVVLV